MQYSAQSYLSLPSKPGVYRFLDAKNNILYVGKAKDLKARVSSYFTNRGLLEEKTRTLVGQIKKITITVVESELESLLLEAYYIKKYQPKYNVRMTDNKSYPLIKITIDDPYPAVFLARRPTDSKALFFGPYPSAAAVRIVLKTIRRIFPYLSSPTHSRRVCLYNHLGLCPCLPARDTAENRKAYRKTLRQIIRILEGESQQIMRELEKEREKASNEERFEEAMMLQKRITALSYITQPFHRPFEYDLNPNLREDLRARELEDLRNILNEAGYIIPVIKRIECYDISHIQGTNTTASLVVFVNGEKEANLYRRFKIRLEKTPDDFASIQEVLTRRLKHAEWEYPELLIVDGGKGQVSAALTILAEKGITIPLIGLAKREETIIIPMNHPAIRSHHSHEEGSDDSIISHQGEKQARSWISQKSRFSSHRGLKSKDENYKEVLLSKDTKALQLIQRVRDEAHRFAITYHKKLRSKNTFLSKEI